MRLICFWCFLVARVYAQEDFYAPQTFRQQPASYQRAMFAPAASGRSDVTPQSSVASPWRQSQPNTYWREESESGSPQSEPWKGSYPTKEQRATILHHKQALSSEGSFSFEYASDNGLSAGEVIEPDGSRIGSYQYKDPSGQLVKLKYRAGKDGFQILEGSHLPKSPEPVPPQPAQDPYYKNAYEMQRQQYELQQQYNLQPRQNWREQERPSPGPGAGAGRQYSQHNWNPQGSQSQDDGQYRESEGERNHGPHSFGSGYSFAFQG